MPTTPVYALRYQALTDPPNGATLGQNLATDVEAQLVRIDALLATQSTVQVFTANGTWTKPAGAKTVRVQCWGGGGAGGGAALTGASQASVGGGGQHGGFAETWFAAGSLSATEAVVIGAGGVGGTGAGPDGAATTFSSAGNLVQAGGGQGGQATSASTAFGVTTDSTLTQTNTGTVTDRGAPGQTGVRNGPDAYGIGGSGGGPGAGNGREANTTGVAGAANTGGGGAGAGNAASQAARNGGDGGSGRCVVTVLF